MPAKIDSRLRFPLSNCERFGSCCARRSPLPCSSQPRSSAPSFPKRGDQDAGRVPTGGRRRGCGSRRFSRVNARRAKVRDTAGAHYSLGLWCERMGLPARRWPNSRQRSGSTRVMRALETSRLQAAPGALDDQGSDRQFRGGRQGSAESGSRVGASAPGVEVPACRQGQS